MKISHSSSLAYLQLVFCRPGLTLWNDLHENSTDPVDGKVKCAYLQLFHSIL